MTKAKIDLDLGSNLGEDEAPVAKPTRVWIELDENTTIPPTGLYIGYNGTGYMLRPGMEAYVPLGVKGILDDAVEATAVLDPASGKVIGYRNKRRYSYRTVDRPHPIQMRAA